MFLGMCGFDVLAGGSNAHGGSHISEFMRGVCVDALRRGYEGEGARRERGC